ncbi:MAG TPA: CvpA family protein [Candidatus Limnocylindria bacterium]|nr:CvpA family protein [Candidatus Limnocylindria bacterium]
MTVPFSWVDAAIVLLIAAAMWGGYRSGFIATTYGLATWIVSFAAAVLFQEPAAQLVERLGVHPAMARPIGFIVVLLLVESLFSIAGFLALTPVVRAVHRARPIERVDRIAGIVPSTARALFVIAIVLAALVVSPVSSDVKATVESSRIARALIDQISALQPTLAKLSGQLGGETVPLFVTRLGEDQSETLDLPSDLRLTADMVAERQMLELVNEERTAAGLRPLAWDESLVPVARQHSEEMFRLKYFSHQSPVSGSPFDRLRTAGIRYTRAGENLAYAQSVAVAHRGLMQSPGHRENILRPEFTQMAVGVISAGPYGRMFTQLFLTP